MYPLSLLFSQVNYCYKNVTNKYHSSSKWFGKILTFVKQMQNICDMYNNCLYLYPFCILFFSLSSNIDKYDYKKTLNPLCKGSGRWWGPLKCVSISRLQLKNPPLLASFFHRKNSKGQKNWHVPSPSISLWKVAALASCTSLALMTLVWTF